MTTGDVKTWIVRRVPLLWGIILARSSLTDIGWYRSAREEMAVDREGNPVPWITYPTIHLLDDRAPVGVRVFEFGTGNSTLWWAKRASVVIACEHDPQWAARAQALAPGNVTVVQPETDSYAETAAKHGLFHVIVIDGIQRVECAKVARHALTESGVIVWDNSDRAEYKPGVALLQREGFRKLDLWGHAPGSLPWGSTTIFYRNGNCLGL